MNQHLNRIPPAPPNVETSRPINMLSWYHVSPSDSEADSIQHVNLAPPKDQNASTSSLPTSVSPAQSYMLL